MRSAMLFCLTLCLSVVAQAQSAAAFTSEPPDAVVVKHGWSKERINWEGDPFGQSFPGGETIAAFQFRVGQAIRRTIDTYRDKNVVVACHGGVVDAALRLALKAPGTGAFEIRTLNTSITEIHLVKDNLWRLISYNDTGHLVGLPTQTTPVPED